MAFPKQVKPNIDLVPPKILSARREELLEYINKDGTYLPKSVLHADLDQGMLDFVKTELETIVSGQKVPVVDKIITTQNWSQFTETWNFKDPDFNTLPPFVTVVRIPEVKYGTNPSTQYTIPVRKQFYYATVPTWNGNMKGYDVYTIPQPVPVDISYQVKIICNRMRELNTFNKNVLQTFASRQAYTFIKGQYVPIINTNITDQSTLDLEKRKFYVQSYDFTMLGFLIDEDEFEVSPAINRVLQVVEIDLKSSKKQFKKNDNPKSTELPVLFVVGNNIITELFNYTVNMNLGDTTNVSSFDVFINNQYYGSDVPEIQINTGDVLKIEVTKIDNTLDSIIKFNNVLI